MGWRSERDKAGERGIATSEVLAWCQLHEFYGLRRRVAVHAFELFEREHFQVLSEKPKED